MFTIRALKKVSNSKWPYPMKLCKRTFMKLFQTLIFFFLFSISVSAQDSIQVYPTHWWTGMKNNKLQLMVHYPNIGSYKAVSIDSNIRLIKVNYVENRNYAFLDLF